MTTLELRGVTKRYGETTALDDVTLDVAEGEFFTLVGPSGCGKTTTLRLVAGFESPTAGEIAFDGRPVGDAPPEARGVGVVFQSYALFPHMTVAENVGYGLRFADPPGGVSRAERVRELLSLVDLEGFGERDPTELSGGQKQRVALARALAPGPRVLLLDEPMSALDARLRERLRAQVKSIQRELGVTTLYVTHDQEEALAVSDRVAVMTGGRVEQVGTPREIYRRPATRFVASFVGDNNLFRGEVVDRTDDRVVVAVDGTPLRVDAARAPPRVGETVTVGVRPERLRVIEERGGGVGGDGTATVRDGDDGTATVRDGDGSPAGDGGPNRLRARVVRTEFLGTTTRVWLDWGGRELTVRTVDPIEGDVTLAFDPGDARLVEGGEDG